MPTGPATTADDIADSIRSLIDRVADAKVTREITKRGQGVAGMLADRGADASDLASDAWRDTKPLRQDAAKRVSRATDDAMRWSDRTWRRSLRPALGDLWKRRTIALGAAGAAVPAGRELVDSAAVRLGLRERQEERHWGAFFLGLLLGAAAGAIAAMLLTPKRGSEMRREIGVRADEVRHEIADRADDLATKAKDADWMPIFQRDETTNGHAVPGDTAPDGTATGETATGETAPGETAPDETAPGETAPGDTAPGELAEEAADATAEAINESYDAVDRESRS